MADQNQEGSLTYGSFRERYLEQSRSKKGLGLLGSQNHGPLFGRPMQDCTVQSDGLTTTSGNVNIFLIASAGTGTL